MAATITATERSLELIHTTLLTHDPLRECIVLGSAAIVAHFAEQNFESPVGCADLDALCSPDYFKRLTVPQPEGTQTTYTVTTPVGMLARRGAVNRTLHASANDEAGLLAFSATPDMSDNWVNNSYREGQLIAVQAAGVRCLPLPHILAQMAQIGRQKDLDKLSVIVPTARDLGLLGMYGDFVEEELQHSIGEKQRNPDRYYARIDI